MVRNSVDHGLEGPAERMAAGKLSLGTIVLSASHQRGGICIRISDDGRGLDASRILAKARERGLIGPDEEPDTSRIYEMIFMPGFSTAEKVTDLSGRGVGMDVVRRNIENLRGKIEIDSVPGEGTTFTIRLFLPQVRAAEVERVHGEARARQAPRRRLVARAVLAEAVHDVDVRARLGGGGQPRAVANQQAAAARAEEARRQQRVVAPAGGDVDRRRGPRLARG
jgi:hypothetical protein